jgi:hypothetical protein
MAKQVHFVVVIEGGVISLDHDTTRAKFPETVVYDTESEQWQDEFDNYQEYEAAQEQLTNLLMATWKDN